jgi:hypothetical protein
VWRYAILGSFLISTAISNAQGGWHLVERLDIPAPVVIKKGGFLPFEPKLIGPPPTGGDFFPSDSWLYQRWPTTNTNAYAYEGGSDIVLDDVLIRINRDPSGQGRFRVSQVGIAVYFPTPGIYEIQGFYAPSSSEYPPEPSSDPLPYNGSNQGPHILFVPIAGVWRLDTNPMNNVFTVQAGRLDGNYFGFFSGLRVSSPAAWVVGVPGDPNITDLFYLFLEGGGEEGGYQAGYFEAAPACFMFRIYGNPEPILTTLQGQLQLEGYAGSYTGQNATFKIKQDNTTHQYNIPLSANGNYSFQALELGPAEVWVKFRSGLAKKVNLNFGGGSVTQNFSLLNGDANNDNRIDDADLLQLLFDFGGSNASSNINGSGLVDDSDLLLVLFNFGAAGDEL